MFLRSLYISLYSLFVMLMVVTAVWFSITSDWNLGWYTQLVGSLSVLTWFVYVRYAKLNNSNFGSTVILAILVATFLIVGGNYRILGTGDGLSASLALANLLTWAVYLFWYSKIPKVKLDPNSLEGLDLKQGNSPLLLIIQRSAECGYSRDQKRRILQEASDSDIECDIVLYNSLDSSDGDLTFSELPEPLQKAVRKSFSFNLWIGMLGKSSDCAIPCGFLFGEDGKLLVMKKPGDLKKLPGFRFFERYLT